MKQAVSFLVHNKASTPGTAKLMLQTIQYKQHPKQTNEYLHEEQATLCRWLGNHSLTKLRPNQSLAVPEGYNSQSKVISLSVITRRYIELQSSDRWKHDLLLAQILRSLRSVPPAGRGPAGDGDGDGEGEAACARDY